MMGKSALSFLRYDKNLGYVIFTEIMYAEGTVGLIIFV
jgi:secreted Zn-dependent insulinase-like peptidase